MKAIRIKIYVAVILLFAAIGVAAIIYSKGGFSIMHEPDPGMCGTVSNQPIITNTHGQKLFSSNCASCHAVNKNLTGPALAGFEERFPIEHLQLFLNKPAKAFAKSKYLENLRATYNGIDHYPFPDLKSSDINDIVAYIKEASE